jgi:site-specific DNA recombinase
MRVAIYIRVSTSLQEKKYSLSAQHMELTKYAEQQNWRIIEYFKDVDSGGKLDKQGLTQLLDIVEEGKIDIVLCIDQDRLSRLDTVAWEYLKSTLRDNGVKIAEPGSIVDLGNEDEEFISDIKNLIAKREKRAIVKRMMRGKRQKMREGKGWGKPPFEYTYNKKEKVYEINEQFAWVIPYIDDLYLNKQYGMMSIASELNKISKTPTGNFWNEHLIHTRIMTKAYHGIMEKEFSNGETISVEVYPKLRTEETWKMLQVEREKRGVQFNVTYRKRVDLHPLRRTLINCGLCGRKISLSQNGYKDKPRFYLKHGRKLKVSDRSVCDISINTVRIEGNMSKSIKAILEGEETAKKYIDLETSLEDTSLLENQITMLDKELLNLQSKSDKLLDSYLDGLFTKEKVLEKQSAIESEINSKQNELSKLRSKLEVIEKNKWNYSYIYDYLEMAADFDTSLTPTERANLIGTLFPTGTLYSDKLVLHADINNVQLDITVPVADDPYLWHRTKNPSVK